MSDAIDDDLANRMKAGFCRCGCGEPTKLAPTTQPSKGWVKGQPMRYVAGHFRRGLTAPPEERFWANVAASPGCWEWTASRRPNGYGRFTVGRKTFSAHRFSYELHNGPVPAGMFVCHRCDNPGCVRPDHLFVATPQENSADRDAKGRANCRRGEDHPHTKLTSAEVRQIRSVMRSGCSPTYLAAQYGVSQSLISQIAARKVWAWLDDE